MSHQFGTRVLQEWADVVLRAGEDIIETRNFVDLCDEALAKMRAEETRAAGEDPLRRCFHVCSYGRVQPKTLLHDLEAGVPSSAPTPAWLRPLPRNITMSNLAKCPV
jgi:hypothetical protein